ncbi:unnamed protein product [Phytophthora lilii]|uniref:Unnamed protein product n=1 Tax=Phytophthora lilii TaxID=2077276 RepID=A0A9W6XEW3_9STRA|nr:unnamed protein product [Phytophthora lilii]
MTRDNQKHHIKHKVADFDAVSLYPSGMDEMNGYAKGKAKLFRDAIPSDADYIQAGQKMSQPPVIQTNIFNSSFFTANSDPLTLDTADRRYLQLGGGSISGSLNVGGSLTVQGQPVVAPPDYVVGITPGLAAANKALVLNGTFDISGINALSVILITGTLSTAAQGNITSLDKEVQLTTYQQSQSYL